MKNLTAPEYWAKSKEIVDMGYAWYLLKDYIKFAIQVFI